MRLHQLLTIEKDVKNETLRVVTDAHHLFEKGPVLAGIARRYRPVTEEGERLPSESTAVQVRVEESLPKVTEALAKLFDLALSKEDANQQAKADIVVDGQVLVKDVPVCGLLFLEKQLVDLHTLVEKLPVLDPSEQWTQDSSQNCWATSPVETARTKKLSRAMVLSEATDKHPAQVKEVTEDVVVGYWSTVRFSGAIPAQRKAELKARVGKLRSAVKVAREDANITKVGDRKMGATLLAYVFGG